MNLSDTQFTEIAKMLREAAKPNGADKRRAGRAYVSMPIQVKFQIGKTMCPWQNSQLRDISARGLRLTTKSPLEPGTSFIVRLPRTAATKNPAPVVCRVVHCTYEEGKTFVIGAEFTGQVRVQKPGGESATEEKRIRGRILG